MTMPLMYPFIFSEIYDSIVGRYIISWFYAYDCSAHSRTCRACTMRDCATRTNQLRTAHNFTCITVGRSNNDKGHSVEEINIAHGVTVLECGDDVEKHSPTPQALRHVGSLPTI